MGPFFTTCLDVMCVCFLGYVKYHKTLWREQTKKDKVRHIALGFIFGLSLADLIVSIILLKQPIISAFLRPLVLASCMASVRSNFMTLVHDIKDSSVILLSIFLFVLVYSVLGHFVFEFTIEGYMYFENLPESYYNMLILLTTANFPDVMLPAYNMSFYWSLYFISFLLLGLYALLNLLLAQVFNSFRTRLVSEGIEYLRRMEAQLDKYFKRFASPDTDYLTTEQMKKFMNELLDMKIDEKEKDTQIYNSLIKNMDPKDSTHV